MVCQTWRACSRRAIGGSRPVMGCPRRLSSGRRLCRAGVGRLELGSEYLRAIAGGSIQRLPERAFGLDLAQDRNWRSQGGYGIDRCDLQWSPCCQFKARKPRCSVSSRPGCGLSGVNRVRRSTFWGLIPVLDSTPASAAASDALRAASHQLHAACLFVEGPANTVDAVLNEIGRWQRGVIPRAAAW